MFELTVGSGLSVRLVTAEINDLGIDPMFSVMAVREICCVANVQIVLLPDQISVKVLAAGSCNQCVSGSTPGKLDHLIPVLTLQLGNLDNTIQTLVLAISTNWL